MWMNGFTHLRKAGEREKVENKLADGSQSYLTDLFCDTLVVVGGFSVTDPFSKLFLHKEM